METPSTNKTPSDDGIKLLNALNAMPEDERAEAMRYLELVLIEKKSTQWIKENFIPFMKTKLKQRMVI